MQHREIFHKDFFAWPAQVPVMSAGRAEKMFNNPKGTLVQLAGIETMNNRNSQFGLNSRPDEAQKSWLAGVFGPDAWRELCAKPEFREALNTSLSAARRIALRYLAAKETGRAALHAH